MRYKKIALFILLAAGLALLIGCGRRAPAEQEVVPQEAEVQRETVISQVIPADADIIVTVTEEESPYSAGFELVIPAGTLERDTEVKINDVVGEVPPLPEGRVFLRHPIYLEPSGLTFRNPVTIRIPISEAVYAQLKDAPASIALRRYDTQQNEWQSIPIKEIVDRAIVAEITTFSTYSVDIKESTRAETVRRLIKYHTETKTRVTIGANSYYIVRLTHAIDPPSLRVVPYPPGRGPMVFVDTQWNPVASEETLKQLTTIWRARRLFLPGFIPLFDERIDIISTQINTYLTIVLLETAFVEASAALLTRGKSLKGTVVTAAALDTITDPMNLVKMLVLADLWTTQASYRAFARLPEITSYQDARRFLKDFIRTEALFNTVFNFLTVEMIKIDRDTYWEIAVDMAANFGRKMAGAIRGIIGRDTKVTITLELAQDIDDLARMVEEIPEIAAYLFARPTDEYVQRQFSRWIASSAVSRYTYALYKATRMMNPDLTVTLVEAPASARVGATISVAFTVRNQGDASASFNDRISLSTTPHGAEIFLGNFSMLLDPGAEIKRVVEVSIPPVPAGDYFLTVYTDSFKKIGETNEGNNIRGAPISITPSLPDPRLPVADAGPDQRVEINTLVTLDGRESYDPDNDFLTFCWTQTAGPAVILVGRTTARPMFIPTAAGTYTFQLTVNDRRADSAPDDVTITVTAPNQPPIADAGPDQRAAVNTEVTLDGSESSDPDEDRLTFRWVQTAGPQVALSDHRAERPAFTPTVANTYTFQLTVNDGRADSVPVYVTITVAEPPAVVDAVVISAVVEGLIAVLGDEVWYVRQAAAEVLVKTDKLV